MNINQDTIDKRTFPDFKDTAIAFSHLSDGELQERVLLFSLMNKPWLVDLGSSLGLKAVKWNLPFARSIVKATLFKQFVGGNSLLNSVPSIEKLAEHQIATILDYGVEATESEDDFNATFRENLRAIEFASSNANVPVVSTKLSGLASNALLEKIQTKASLTEKEAQQWLTIQKIVEAICYSAHEKKVAIFIDAEESWIQDPIDEMVMKMMQLFNKDRCIVYNTYQMYRHDRLEMLKSHAQKAREEGWILGAKIVRGAYMEKERARAKSLNYPSPIHKDKASTDDSYNQALLFLVDHYKEIASCNATHNTQSCILMANRIDELGADRNHPHLNFSQLYGMSDTITYNLAACGYNVAKYVPYGKVEQVIPYLIRRAEENTAVTGEMSRELELFHQELNRRKQLSSNS